MIRVLRSLTLVLAVLASFALQPATAQEVASCGGEIQQLRGDTWAASFIGRNAEKDQLALIDKLDEASAKLDAGKIEDAVQKLVDFRGKVGVLSTQQKIELTDATALIAQANVAIGCINSPA